MVLVMLQAPSECCSIPAWLLGTAASPEHMVSSPSYYQLFSLHGTWSSALPDVPLLQPHPELLTVMVSTPEGDAGVWDLPGQHGPLHVTCLTISCPSRRGITSWQSG